MADSRGNKPKAVVKEIPSGTQGAIRELGNATPPARKLTPPAPAITRSKNGESDAAYMKRAQEKQIQSGIPKAPKPAKRVSHYD